MDLTLYAVQAVLVERRSVREVAGLASAWP
jgi:hypothetical protein